MLGQPELAAEGTRGPAELEGGSWAERERERASWAVRGSGERARPEGAGQALLGCLRPRARREERGRELAGLAAGLGQQDEGEGEKGRPSGPKRGGGLGLRARKGERESFPIFFHFFDFKAIFKSFFNAI